ncbi:class I SAM-dependent methyltransferase [Flavobacterium piscinae]|uniref:Class I SAM-dependent methyltransferase n=1 Tax=Flavobacterium piscinae TaxID=2506424 RepID=A0A4Q1KLJ1_9FLAO|nr:class I SAM-dependent methyltransferase [Flavobacterium piscinae]MBC8884385.1 class I SAM-dependent methyltransferase [Flavobacterium piscinae]RXR30607.1 class I SAM-dependent methyltransferase [Flavobacterium piscinae]
MKHILKSYLKFLYHSKNEHGVHSPFVFDLVTKCFYNKTNYLDYSILKAYRNSLLENENTIEVTDFGAGSRVFKSNKRKVSAIAKNAGISIKNGELLFRMVRYFQPEYILEIGTSLGLATSALSLGNKNSKIITLEGCPNTMAIAKNQCQLQNLNNIDFVHTKFEDFLITHNPQPTTYNFIYFDGNHSKSATLNYFELLLPTILNDSAWIFDDIHWSKDMEEAWKVIKNHPKVTVTIDTFQWGIVFFRKEQEKEHFVIRA